MDLSPVPPHALAAPAPRPSRVVLILALLGAGLFHLFLILTVSFEMPEPNPEVIPDEALEILILKQGGTATDDPAVDAALSQRSRAGESPEGDSAISDFEPELVPEPEIELEPVLESPPTVAPVPAPEPPPPPEPVPEPEPEPEPAPQEPVSQVSTPELLPDILEARSPKKVDAAQILSSRNREIARLTASLEARSAAYASRERRRSISASTREFRYASYLGAWARKVERIGNLNYPQEAKDKRLHGDLILHVSVRKDGSVEDIRVVRSSGQELLDQAAIRIVELAAPFSPFPPDIAAETDILDIIRTWRFLRGGGLGW